MTRRIALLASLLCLLVFSFADAATPLAKRPLAVATFAGGCFWCTEHDFEEVPGVVSVISGYTGGTTQHPSYEEVSAGGTGHFESVEVHYDPSRVNYAQLVDYFWHNVDPFNAEGQFCDEGDQYRSVIFYRNAEEKRIAETTKARVEARFKKKVATLILPATAFWRAEEYHQGYAKKNPVRYKFYRFNCGRDARLEKIWGKK